MMSDWLGHKSNAIPFGLGHRYLYWLLIWRSEGKVCVWWSRRNNARIGYLVVDN